MSNKNGFGRKHKNMEVARPGRLELPTLCLEGRRSIQLSYGRIVYYLDFRTFLALRITYCSVRLEISNSQIQHELDGPTGWG